MQFTAFDNSGNVLYSTQGGVWRGVGSGCTRTFTNTFFVGSAAGKGLYTDSLGSVYWGHNHNTSAPNVVYRSLDGGQTFSAWDTGLPQGLEMHDCIENANDGQIYCTIEDGQTNNGWVYRTNK
jgi:hypothetical protein